MTRGGDWRPEMQVMRALGIGIIIVLLVGAVAWVCAPVLLGTAYGLSAVPEMLSWRAKTTPLDPEVITDLCSRFGLRADDQQCEPGAEVYAPDFFGVVRGAFQPSSGPWATYDEVQEKLGEYQYRYESPVTTGDGLTYFVAGYDLRGDRVYPIVMFFYENGRLWRLIADVGD